MQDYFIVSPSLPPLNKLLKTTRFCRFSISRPKVTKISASQIKENSLHLLLLSLRPSHSNFLSFSLLLYSSSRGVTVHMVLQHCWSPVATLPTMHLWLWALEGADRLRGLWYRPAIAWFEGSSVQQWSVSKPYTPLTSTPSSILPINPLPIVTFASIKQSSYFLLYSCVLLQIFWSKLLLNWLISRVRLTLIVPGSIREHW